MKTHSGSKKRFRLTASGKIKFTKSRKRHLLTKKSRKSKRDKSLPAYISSSDMRHIKSLII